MHLLIQSDSEFTELLKSYLFDQVKAEAPSELLEKMVNCISQNPFLVNYQAIAYSKENTGLVYCMGLLY